MWAPLQQLGTHLEGFGAGELSGDQSGVGTCEGCSIYNRKWLEMGPRNLSPISSHFLLYMFRPPRTPAALGSPGRRGRGCTFPLGSRSHRSAGQETPAARPRWCSGSREQSDPQPIVPTRIQCSPNFKMRSKLCKTRPVSGHAAHGPKSA